MKTRQKQTGLAAIEVTIILPFLLLIIFVVAEFGRLLYQYNALNKAVRNTARHVSSLAKLGSQGSVVTLNSDTQIEGNNLLRYGDTSIDDLILPNLDNSTINYSVSGQLVTVSISYPWRPLFASTVVALGVSSDSGLGFPLRVSYTMRAR
ncbi:hypothetical protein GCM10007895_02080 [Paraferrimonas sedimenticola]|uniref:TadE-like domain-containing protein n=2 Tax=Paraferrimonas sedimenticola TaxID=375674 RepID=A0AA37W0E5_9GAMM|nr:hypothetical protein GCM10007895_02080 [Paraferrimonas sedimenticola]